MKIERHVSAADFLSAAGSFLYEREAEYGLIVGLAEGLRASVSAPPMPPVLVTLSVAGMTRAAFLQTRPGMGCISHIDAVDSASLANYLVEAGIALQSIVGPLPDSERFMRDLGAQTGRQPQRVMAQRILAAERVESPRTTVGEPVVATPAEADAAFEFLRLFYAECLPHDPFEPSVIRKMIQQKIERGFIFFWKRDGELVASAQLNRPTRNGISIGAVYTPPASRGNGYASNLMAHITRSMLDQGRRFCVLYTDASNPTSNKIYESVGYRLIGESEHWEFRVEPQSHC